MQKLNGILARINESSEAYYIIAALIFLINVIIKFFLADAGSLYLDEAFSAYHSQKTFTDMMEVVGNDPNPPLHFIFLHFWIKIFGISEYAIRSLSGVFSTLSVIVILTLYTRHFSRA